MRRPATAACGLMITAGLAFGIGATSSARTSAHRSAAISARIDERTVRFSPALHSGLVRLHVTNSGRRPHHLLFWQLHSGVSFSRFDKVDAAPDGNPLKLASLVGGNGQLAPGKALDIWIRVATGQVAIDDLPAGGGNGFHLDLKIHGTGPSAAQPNALGTVAALPGDHLRLPAGFGRPGTWEFVNQDKEPHEAAIARLAPGRTVADVITWAKHRNGPPPLSSADGGFGALGAHSHAWFTVGRLAPGSYAVICFVPGPTGAPHAAMGMVSGFTVR